MALRRKLARMFDKVSEVAANPKAAIEGRIADTKRGRLYHKQGYGNTYDSAYSLAKRGKKNLRKGPRRR